jgi:cytochrome P450/NADPH-cytochrome P450 reductase
MMAKYKSRKQHITFTIAYLNDCLFQILGTNLQQMSKSIPQPAETFLIGNLKEINHDRFLESLQRLQKLYGDIFRITIFRKSFVIVCTQELANFVCDESKFDKKLSQSLLEV